MQGGVKRRNTTLSSLIAVLLVMSMIKVIRMNPKNHIKLQIPLSLPRQPVSILMTRTLSSPLCGQVLKMAVYMCTIQVTIYVSRKIKSKFNIALLFCVLCEFSGVNHIMAYSYLHNILSFRYLDNKVYVSLANGEITIYERDASKF